MKRLLFLLLIVSQSQSLNNLYAKNDSTYFFSSNLLFVPPKAAIFEAKTGVTKFIDDKNLKLDIGATFDIAGMRMGKNNFSFGVDFITFSSLRSESNFKFPVDAIDYMFGVNFNYKRDLDSKNIFSARLRISHISSHLEDGHIYEDSDTIFTPFVFSKEFIDVAAMDEYSLSKDLSVKSMIALNFVFHAIPKGISTFSGQLGIELRYYLYKSLSLYLSNDNTFATVNGTSNLNESFESGVSIGEKGSRSISVYFDYYDGQDYRGQYYGGYLNYKGIGLRFEL